MAGTAAAVDYFAWIGSEMAGATGSRQARAWAGMELLVEYEKTLSRHLITGLRSLDGVTVHGITDEIAAKLGEDNIFVWSGHNYAVEAARSLGIYDTGGAVRVGPVHYNSIAEIDALIATLETILPS